jgi:RNA polymerase sigma factor (sigma-70 family)
MAQQGSNLVVRFLRRIVAAHGGGDATDGQLLNRFAAEHDESAFAALVQRHGPMVLGVCRRLLPELQDAEDAFQATFLVLVRKASSIARSELLGNWLYGVAHRTALEARRRAARRRARERQVPDMAAVASSTEAVWSDLRPVLDEEVGRLPAKFRLPVVLCYFEGRTNEEAARLLGCPKGTVLSRLASARERLRDRLTRRGLALPAGLFAAALSENGAAAMPPGLLDATVRAAVLAAVGDKAAVSGPVAVLAAEVVRAMGMTKLKYLTATLLAVGLVGAGAGVGALAHRGGMSEPADVRPEGGAEAPARDRIARAGDKELVPAAGAEDEQERAIAEIRRLGGQVYIEGSPEDRAVRVVLQYAKLRDGDLACLKGVRQLRYLSLYGSQVTDAGLAHLQRLTTLQDLDLAVTKVTDGGLAKLKGLKQLQSLNLLATNISDAGLAHLRAFPRLQTLGLRGTKVTDAGLATLQPLFRLQTLDLAETRVTDAGLARLRGWTQLRSLGLEGTQITDDGLAALEGLTDLQTLVLIKTAVTDRGLRHLRKLPWLKSLYLDHTRVNGSGFTHLKDMTGLRLLGLNFAPVTDEGLKNLRGLTGLGSLYLWDAKITDAGLTHLEGLTNLHYLNVMGTKVTDAGLVSLQKLPHLQTLLLGKTPVTDAGLAHLERLTSLTALNLTGTAVTDAGVKRLQQALPKVKVTR